MLAKLCYFFVADGQHFNVKNAWFCRENKNFEKKQAPNLASMLTLQHIFIYIYIYTYAVKLLTGPSLGAFKVI